MRRIRLAATVALIVALSACLPHRHIPEGIAYPPVRSGHGWRTMYKTLRGPLFAAGGPSPYDVEQGDVGTCWLLSAMAATAHQQPQRIREMFQPERAGRLRVTFANPRPSAAGKGHDVRTGATQAEEPTVIITPEVPHSFLGGPIYARSRRGIWVSLLERAYAQAFAPNDGYDGIGGDHPRLALAHLTGWRVSDYDIDGDLSPPDEDEEWQHLLEAYRGGAPMVAGSRVFQPRHDIVPMHAYAVTGLYQEDDGDRFVELFDPEGLNRHVNHEVTLSLDHFNDYFFYVSIAHPPAPGVSSAVTP